MATAGSPTAVTSWLDHPGICAVYDVGLEDRPPYIAMRYVEGESLAQRIGATKARAQSDATLLHVELPGTDAVEAAPPNDSCTWRQPAVDRSTRSTQPSKPARRSLSPFNPSCSICRRAAA